jgi:hypothetical protein
MTKDYRHTQHAGPGWWFQVAVLVALALGVEAWFNGYVVLFVAAMLIALIAGPVFMVLSRLTVEVDDIALRAFFWRGWPCKTLPLAEARSVQAVRNHWWYGFGIWWIPRGTVWTVWGFDAIQFELSSGRVLRIGTDEPEALLAALESRVLAH